MADLVRKPRSATVSNLDDYPGNRLVYNNQSHGSHKRLPNPFAWRLKKQRGSKDYSTNSLAAAQKSNTLNVNRPVYTQDNFDKGFGEQTAQQGIDFKQKIIKCCSCECTGKCWKKFFLGLFPFIGIMGNYNIREDLVGDVIAGLTVGIMNIPQGMAYALLAAVPPIYGLYVSFFPVLIYFFFGTSRHNSIGTFAVVCLMVGGVVESQCSIYDEETQTTTTGPLVSDAMNGNVTYKENITTTATSITTSWLASNLTTPNNVTTTLRGLVTTTDYYSSPLIQCKLGVFTTLTFFVGVIQILMGVGRLGFVTIYLADPLISGFTTGAACHVLTSQIKYVFGIKAPRASGIAKLPKNYVNIFSNIATINPAEIIIALFCIITLVLVKICINERFKKKMFMPVPIDLIVVILGTVISYAADFEGRWNVLTLGDIPAQFPNPSIPPIPYQDLGVIIPSAFTIAVVAFAVSVSMAKIFAKKHNYEVDSNQELIALGITNTVSSFFSCFTSCASLSRSAVQDNQGGRSQLAGVVSCFLVLLVLIVLGPYFATLPNSVLAAIILVALKGMLLQFQELKRLWHISYYDFAIWLVTWIGVVALDVDVGLGVGVVFGLLTVVFRTQFPSTTILARVPHTDLYKDKDIYPTTQEVSGVKIFRIDAALYYANVEHFRNKLYKLTTINPRVLKLQRSKIEKKVDKEKKVIEDEQKSKNKKLKKQKTQNDSEAAASLANDGLDKTLNTADIVPAEKRDGWPVSPIHHVIIDCSMMSYVDSVGVNCLRSIYSEYSEVDVCVFLVNCKSGVREMFRRCRFYDKVPENKLYLTIHDGVIAALSQQREQLEQLNRDCTSYMTTWAWMPEEPSHNEEPVDEVSRDTRIVSRPSSMYSSAQHINKKDNKGSRSILPTLPGEDAEGGSDEENDEEPVNGEAHSVYL